MYGAARSILFRIEPETAHEVISWQLQRLQAVPPLLASIAAFLRPRRESPKRLWGLTFRNVLGIAAGFDKNAAMVRALGALGFGFVEVGTVTLNPQSGNPRPRMFRYPRQRALVNRLGFNNDGAERVARRLRDLVEHRGTTVEQSPRVLVNLGKNREVPLAEAAISYGRCYRIVAPWAEGAVVNVSSPNTPTLRELQRPEHLREILLVLREERARTRFRLTGEHPILVKVAPDMESGALREFTDVCRELADGIVATNTTLDHSGLGAEQDEAGGLSGAPLFDRSTAVLREIRARVGTGYPLVGVGGVMDGTSARAKVEAGADLIQAYTGFVYGGPRFPARILEELAS